jgi:hypothetical protein
VSTRKIKDINGISKTAYWLLLANEKWTHIFVTNIIRYCFLYLGLNFKEWSQNFYQKSDTVVQKLIVLMEAYKITDFGFIVHASSYHFMGHAMLSLVPSVLI